MMSPDLSPISNAEPSASGKDRRKDRLLRIASVRARTGLSVATIYRREAERSFPERQRIGIRSVAWYESDIDDFVADPLSYRR
jgi:prophage regulatory protein